MRLQTEAGYGILNRLEIDYEVDSLAERTVLVKSPNLDISVSLTISIILGPNVLSVQNHNLAGKITLDRGAVAIDGEWVEAGELGDSPILYPVRFFRGIAGVKLG
mgnify:CR=1 FL=1